MSAAAIDVAVASHTRCYDRRGARAGRVESTGPRAVGACEPRQIRKEAALSNSFQVRGKPGRSSPAIRGQSITRGRVEAEMLEPFEYRGVWWLPDAPEHKVAGVLTFSQDDVCLELIGLLPREHPDPDPATGVVTVPTGPVSRPRILGLSTSGKILTLEDCMSTNWNFSFPGMMTERFLPRLILEGAHYGLDEDIIIDELSIRYSQLDAWVSISGIQQSSTSEDADISFGVSFRPPDSIEVAIGDLRFEIAFSWQVKDAAPLGTSFSIDQHAAFFLHFNQPLALEEAFDYVYQLRNFLALGVGRPVSTLTITGYRLPPSDAEPDPRTGREPHKTKLDIFYRLHDIPETKNVHPAQMLFTFADTRERLATLLGNWFAKQDLLRPVFDLYFGAIYNRHAYLEQRFLSLIQAIETYHRRTSNATELPVKEHELWLSDVISSTAKDHRERLSAKLKYSNELSLHNRLREISTLHPLITDKIIDRPSFVHRVRVARNYLTHFDPSLENQATKGIALYPLAVQLQALVEMCLLLEIGFEREEIDAFFTRVGRYREVELALEDEGD